MISTIKELRYKLSLKNTLSLAEESTIASLFDEIAKFLIEECVILWNGRKYGFRNIEFYFFNRNHQDIITHPRRSKALQWFVNDFGGIDLNFESCYDESEEYYKNNSKRKPLLNDNCCFCGILIRELLWINGPDGNPIVLRGPLACAEMFRLCDAVDGKSDFPVLTAEKSNLRLKQKSAEDLLRGRYNIYCKSGNVEAEINRKVGNIMNNYGKESLLSHADMQQAFDKYKDKPYWYCAESL